jgi:hypothetical protein
MPWRGLDDPVQIAVIGVGVTIVVVFALPSEPAPFADFLARAAPSVVLAH